MTITPTAHEQYMLELINRARANPNAEVLRNPDVADLNEGLAANTITPDAKQPLAFNWRLIDAARRHSQWMLDTDTFSHTGVNGTSPQQRMVLAGYTFTGNGGSGENISWRGTTGTPDVTQFVGRQHDGLFDSPGHRANLMNPNFKEVGLGALPGTFLADGINWNTVMVTQKFARSGSSSFLTGVVYTDGMLNDDFYTVGEGLGGITIRATRLSDNQAFSTTSFGSGGYQIALTAGTYNVQFSGGSLGQTITYANVAIADLNLKLDLATDRVTGSNAITYGTENVDLLIGIATGDSIYGLAGNDTIRAGAGDDQVFGGQGQDVVLGQNGADSLNGGAGNDTLFGGDGNDTLMGANANAVAPGRGEIDTLDGGLGGDRFILASTSRTFYTDGVATSAGTGDYALIQNFQIADGDVIQLRGNASSYLLGNAPSGLPTGTAIFVRSTINDIHELIGVVQGVTGLSLTSGSFSYV